MKITIDTKLKTIKVEEPVNFCELNNDLKKLLGEAVKEYVLLASEHTAVSQWGLLPFYQTFGGNVEVAT